MTRSLIEIALECALGCCVGVTLALLFIGAALEEAKRVKFPRPCRVYECAVASVPNAGVSGQFTDGVTP